MKLDRDGLEYLLKYAADIGFGARCVETKEEAGDCARVWIQFIQTRRVHPKPEAKPDTPTEEPPKKPQNVLRMLDGTEI